MHTSLPGVLLGVFEELTDEFPGDEALRAEELEELEDLEEQAFLCHLAMGAFVMGMSSFRMLWMSLSNPN